MFYIWLVIGSLLFSPKLEGFLAGGRPNSFSGGTNAFAGIANPANAVWIPDRYDVGAYWVNQKSDLNNLDNNPLFPPGKTNTSYRANNLYSFDAAITKQIKITEWEGSFGIAFYFAPNRLATGTKEPIAITGTTPQAVRDTTKVLSAIFSLKLNTSHSVGFSLDYFYLSHLRNGYQNADNPERSVSPGHVTNNGTDHSGGLGLTLGWRWKITPSLDFGIAWIKKSYVGQFRKYRGFEPDHAKNFIPQTIGGGFGYRPLPKLAGRAEMLWVNSSHLPGSDLSVLPNGEFNTHKRGSKKSPGPGLQDAILLNLGLGYQFTTQLALGMGFSHRFKNSGKNRYILSHSYRSQVIYDLITLGANFKYKKHDFYLTLTHGFNNRVEGLMPTAIGGGRFTTDKSNNTAFFSWGYLY